MAMLLTYPETITMREARRMYFEANRFGENGGYDEPWVDFHLGPIPMPFPNTKSRVAAVRYHDLHHILTGYDTSFVGELEISGWEIGAGCKSFAAAWVLNLGGMAGGLFRAPGRVFSAFVRGRRARAFYGEEFEPLLDLTVAEARARFGNSHRGTTVADVALFILAAVAGLVVALVLLALIIPMVPLGLLNHARRKADRRGALPATLDG